MDRFDNLKFHYLQQIRDLNDQIAELKKKLALIEEMDAEAESINAHESYETIDRTSNH